MDPVPSREFPHGRPDTGILHDSFECWRAFPRPVMFGEDMDTASRNANGLPGVMYKGIVSAGDEF